MVISKTILGGIARMSLDFQSQGEYYCLEKRAVIICSQNFLSFLSQCYFRCSNLYLFSAGFP